MAETVLFPEQTIGGFSFDEQYGAYIANVNPAPFEPILGETYRVTWDGGEYLCLAQDASAIRAGTILLGNGASWGLSGNGEPFIIGCAEAGVSYLAIDSAVESHTLAVCLVEAESGLVTENFDGTRIVHSGVETVSLYDTNDEIQTFVHEDLVAEPVETIVDLDFSAGDMTIMPEEGLAFSSVKIPVPEGLEAANIPVGTIIAGITGAREDSGGGNVKIATGTFKNPYRGTITHNLGVIPDIVLVASKSYGTSKGRVVAALGCSAALIGLYPDLPGQWMALHRTDDELYCYVGKGTITDDTVAAFGENVAIGNATETTFDYGGTDYSGDLVLFDSTTTKIWIAIGGLT